MNCQIHLSVTMHGERLKVPGFADDYEANEDCRRRWHYRLAMRRKKNRIILRCPIEGCPRVAVQEKRT